MPKLERRSALINGQVHWHRDLFPMAFPLSRQISLKTKSWKRYHHHLNNHSGSSQASYGRRKTPPESFHQPKGNAAARWIGQIKYAQKITLRNIYGSAELYRPLKKKARKRNNNFEGVSRKQTEEKLGKETWKISYQPHTHVR